MLQDSNCPQWCFIKELFKNEAGRSMSLFIFLLPFLLCYPKTKGNKKLNIKGSIFHVMQLKMHSLLFYLWSPKQFCSSSPHQVWVISSYDYFVQLIKSLLDYAFPFGIAPFASQVMNPFVDDTSLLVMIFPKCLP